MLKDILDQKSRPSSERMEDLTIPLQDAKETKIQALNELNNTGVFIDYYPIKLPKVRQL